MTPFSLNYYIYIFYKIIIFSVTITTIMSFKNIDYEKKVRDRLLVWEQE